MLWLWCQDVTPPIPYARLKWNMRQINSTNNNIITCSNLFLKLYTYFLRNSPKEGMFKFTYIHVLLALL